MLKLLNRDCDWFVKDNQYELCLTDDIDSLFACAILKQYKGWEITKFYSFNEIYCTGNAGTHETVYIDCAVNRGKCIDNHVTKFKRDDVYNKESINLNLLCDVANENYTDKYAGSTLLEVLSLCGFTNEQMFRLNDEQKGVLLAIDSTFKGYIAGGKFRRKNMEYLLKLGYKCLIAYEDKHRDSNYYTGLLEKYKINKTGKISVKNGHIVSSMDLDGLNSLFKGIFNAIELPSDLFVKDVEFNGIKQIDASKYQNKNLNAKWLEKVFSHAFTYRNSLRATMV